MQALVRKLNDWAYGGETFIKRWRTARMRAMLRLLRLPPDARVVDLGGTDYMWNLVSHDFRVTIVNLPDPTIHKPDPSRFTFLEADACDLKSTFADGEFDLAFSNSVIEHVGAADRQQAFADEARRVATAYWVQTPSDRFPIEAHTGVPYYWDLPDSIRGRLQRRWREDFGVWGEMIQSTRVLSAARMRQLFPDGQLFVERQFGFDKSHAMYRAYPVV